MNQLQKSELVEITRNKTLFGSSMVQYTSFRAGGSAEAVCFVDDKNTLVQLMSYLRKEDIPHIAIGKGSNILVKDKGLKGAVIILEGSLADIESRPQKREIISAGGGLPVAELLHYCVREELSGLEFMAGIPGTVGGAIVMNAGAHGHEICECLKDVSTVNSMGEDVVIDRSRIDFGYRESSIPPGSVVYRAALKLKHENREDIKRRISEYLEKRKKTQPVDLPSCGSVFRNPSGDFAGRLIEQAGLKGKKLGGAMISPEHANYIVNTGGAKASDIIELMELARKKVSEKFGIRLVPEVRVVGE